MRIADVLRRKGSAVATVTETTTITGLLAEMATRNIGAMVVVRPDGQGGAVGMVSERDVVRKLQQRGAGLLGQPVSEIMTSLVVTCTPEDTVDDLAPMMTNNRVRHVPVLVDGCLAGIVSIGDVVKTRMEELETEQEQLHAYITRG